MGDYLLRTQAYRPIVTYPLYAVPHKIVSGNPLDGNFTPIGQHELPLRDASDLRLLADSALLALAALLALRASRDDPLLRYAQHGLGGGLVNLPGAPELGLDPLLPGERAEHAGLDRVVVAHHEDVALGRDQAGPHGALGDARCVSACGPEQQAPAICVACFVPGEILRLDASARLAPGVGAVEPEGPADAPVPAALLERRLMLRHAGQRGVALELQDLGHVRWAARVGQRFLAGLLRQRQHRVALVVQPAAHLLDGVGVRQPGARLEFAH